MQPLTFTFLGTGTSGGVPMVACSCPVCSSPNVFDKRLRSSLLVQSSTTTVVIDATPDFRQQMLTHGIKKLDAVVLTHAHKDHVGGLDDTRGFQYIQQQPTRIYGHAATLAGVKLELHYAFADRVYPGVPQIELITLTEEAFTIGDINFLPILVWHHKMPVHGYRIGSFTYITDANRIEDAELKKMEGSEVLVLNALRHEPHISHFSLQEAVAIARRLQVPQTYFTHISHQLGLHAQVNPSLPAGMALAYDGLVVCI